MLSMDTKNLKLVFTEAEALQLLRLDNPETLRRYRESGLLIPTKYGNRIFYTLKSLQEFIEQMTFSGRQIPHGPLRSKNRANATSKF